MCSMCARATDLLDLCMYLMALEITFSMFCVTVEENVQLSCCKYAFSFYVILLYYN